MTKNDQNHRLMQFLMGFHESYTGIWGNILMMSPLPSISQAYSLLIQEEHQRKVHAISQFLQESASLNANSQRSFDNSQSQQVSQQAPSRSSVVCSHCNKTGHPIERCYRLIGFPLVIAIVQEDLQTMLRLMVLLKLVLVHQQMVLVLKLVKVSLLISFNNWFPCYLLLVFLIL